MINREILFRGKRINNGEWIEGSIVINGDRNYIIPHDWKNPEGDGWVKVDPATVGQYTGLKDKNGVKIFEGDVVRDKSGNVGEVRYSDHFKRLNIHFTAGREDLVQERELGTHIFCWTFPNMHLLVISNIHDATPQGEE